MTRSPGYLDFHDEVPWSGFGRLSSVLFDLSTAVIVINELKKSVKWNVETTQISSTENSIPESALWCHRKWWDRATTERGGSEVGWSEIGKKSYR
jgi:hypothetical protein